MCNLILRSIDQAEGRSMCEHDCVPAESRAAAEAVEHCLRDTGAVKRCTLCGERFVVAKDERAERRAHERAEHLWKAGLRGFEGMTRTEIVEAIEAALHAVPSECPACRR